MTAGSASAAVNAASPGLPASLPGIVQPASTGSSTPGSSSSSSSVPTSASVPGPVLTLPGEAVVVGEPVPGAPTQQRFVIGEAATVIVDTVNGRLQVVALAPHPGWAIVEFEQDDDGTFELRLESPIDRVRFDAAIVDGVPVATIRPDDDGPSVTTPGMGSGPAATTPGGGSAVTPGVGSAVTTPGSGSTVTTVDDHGGDRDDDDDDRTSSTVVTTPSGGSTVTTIDDHGGDRGPGGGDDDHDDHGGDD